MDDETSGNIKFSLLDTPTHARGKVWKDSLNKFFYDYDFVLPQNFHYGWLKGCHVGAMSIASIESDPMSVTRTKSHIARNPLDAYFVLLTADNPLQLSQRGSEANLCRGGFSLVSTSNAYAYVQNGRTLFNNLIIPGDVVRQFAPRADDAVARALGERPIEKMFYDYANAICTNHATLSSRAKTVLSRHLIELLGLVLDGTDCDSVATPVRMMHFRRISNYVEDNFDDPDINVAAVSKAVGLSVRYVQSVTMANGTSISRMIRTRRVVEARRLLESYGTRRISISEIAFKVGFSDLSHFSRVFRNETGHAPSDLRRTD